MQVEAEVKRVPLSKARLLEYLEGQQAPTTAKAVSIDLDCHAGTAHEMLERCAAQGLIACDRTKRPREFQINEPGRERLKSFHSSLDNPQSQSADPPEEPGPEPDDGPEQAGPVSVSDLREEIVRQFEGLREDLRDFFEALGLRRLPGEELPALVTRVEQIKNKLQSLAGEAEQKLTAEAVVHLYQLRYELRSLGWSDDKESVRKRIAELEGQLGAEIASKINDLSEQEKEIGDAKRLRSILELRQSLNLPGEVFDRAERKNHMETVEGKIADAAKPKPRQSWDDFYGRK